MTRQQLLPFARARWAGGSPPSNGSDTSAQAADHIKPHAGSLRQSVLAYILGRGEAGATDAEIQHALGLSGDVERPRRWELQRAGLIVDSGSRRLTPSRRSAIVWIPANQ